MRRRDFNRAMTVGTSTLLVPMLQSGCAGEQTGVSQAASGDAAGSPPVQSPTSDVVTTGSAGASPSVEGSAAQPATQPVEGAPESAVQNPQAAMNGTEEDAVLPQTPEPALTATETDDPAQAEMEDAVSDVEPVESTGSRATEKVALGQSGLMVPRIAMGTGSAGWERASDQTRLGQKKFTELMRYGAERGAAFIDAADLYGSHSFVKSTFQELPRENVTLLSKIWFRPDAPKMDVTDTARPEVERFLTELGTDMIDIMLVHAVLDPQWPTMQARMRDELSELKQQGIIRAVGCSAHTHGALRVAAEDPWVDVIFARINPGRKHMDEDATVDEVAETLKLARRNGKGVVGMKIYGAGDWSSTEQRKESLNYAWSNGLIDAMTIGSLSPEQLDDTIVNTEAVLA